MKKIKKIVTILFAIFFFYACFSCVNAASYPSTRTWSADNLSKSGTYTAYSLGWNESSNTGDYLRLRLSTSKEWGYELLTSPYSLKQLGSIRIYPSSNANKYKYYLGVICFQHSTEFDATNSFSIEGRIIFDKDSFTVYYWSGGKMNSGTLKSATYKYTDSTIPYAALISYVIAQSGKSVENGISNADDKRAYQTFAQWLYWMMRGYDGNTYAEKFYESLPWAKALSESINSGENISWNSNTMTTSEYKDLLSTYYAALKYQEFRASYKEPSVTTSPKTLADSNKSYTYSYKSNGDLLVGPFKVTFTEASTESKSVSNFNKHSFTTTAYKIAGILDTKKIYYTDSNGKTVTLNAGDSTWYVCDKNGNATTISSGTEFYIYIYSSQASKIKSLNKVEIYYRYVYTTGDAAFVRAGDEGQLWSGIAECALNYETITLSMEVQSTGSLTIKKTDANTGTALSGYTVYLQDSSGNYYNSSGTNKGSTKTTISISSTSGITINNLPIGTYTVTETSAPSGYTLSLQSNSSKAVTTASASVAAGKTASVNLKNVKFTNLSIKKVDKTTGEKIEGIGFTIKDNSTLGGYIDANGNHVASAVTLYTDSNGEINISNVELYSDNTTFTVTEVASENLYYKADTSIVGTITGKSNTSCSVTIENETSYALTISKNDEDAEIDNQELTATFVIQYLGIDGKTTDEWLQVDDSGNISYSANQSEIIVETTKTIEKIREGIYHIYEVESPTGYDLTQQENYDSTNNWVDCGITYVGINSNGEQDDNACKPTTIINNEKWIKEITGYVWLDNPSGKSNEFNYQYDDDNDELLEGITVELVNLQDNSVIVSTTTNSEGEYSFSLYRQIIYWDLENYVIRFTVDNSTYTTVPVNTEPSYSNVSRAIEESDYDWENDTYADGSGTVTTIDNATDYTDSLAQYYNEDNYTIETINLGLMQKVNEEFSIIENIDYVKIVQGSYEFTYAYSKDAVVQEVEEREYIYNAVAIQNSARTFTQKLYPSDIAYNYTTDSNKFEVYVVYNIAITNTMNLSMDDLYVEESLMIESLKNTYSDIYELSDSAWSVSGTNEATYNNTISAISAGESVNIPITFKVTETGLKELVQNSKTYNTEVFQECNTIATASGYHNYTRNDYSWKYDADEYLQTNQHRTKGEDRNSGALTLYLKLSEQRTISGNVFEDTDATSDDNTTLGDGLYNSTDENKVTVVDVELLNTDGTVATLYSTEGDYLKQNASGTWEFNTQEGKVSVANDGTYSFVGVIPGTYYLRFIYSDGTEVIKTDGSENTTIDLMSYKSTIFTGEAKDTDEYWYLDVMGGTNSVATDKTYINESGDAEDIIVKRTTSDEEINYTSQNEFNKGTIQAESATMNVQFEYLNEVEAEYNYEFESNCSGMNFGIIERPHTEITLEKTIDNVKITLSNGTTVINENPNEQIISPYLSNLSEDGSYVRVEMDTSLLYGSTATITYKLTATNKSELDYATEEFYKYGTTDDTKIVTTTVTKIIDYVAEENCDYSNTNQSENVTLTEDWYNEYSEFDSSLKNKKVYFEENVAKENEDNYNNQLIATSEEELYPEAYSSSGEVQTSTDYTITISKLISISDEDMGWGSYSEIIGLKNVTFSAQFTSTSGNYKAADTVSTSEGGTSEADNAGATIVITPATGENHSYMIYAIAGVVLIILAAGIIVAKKKVI